MTGKAFSRALSVLILLSLTPTAFAAVKLNSIQVKQLPGNIAVDLAFDGPVAAKLIRPSFERNFIQYALKSTKMDSSQIVPVTGTDMQKVFAYPYSPDTVRVRLILKKEGAQAKGIVSAQNLNAKVVRIKLKDPNATAPKDGTSVSAVKKPEPPKAAPLPKLSVEDGNLLKEVITNTPEIDIHNPDSVKAALSIGIPSKPDPKTEKKEETANAPIGIKTDPTKQFSRMAIGLFSILGVFLGLVWAVRKYAVNLKKLPFGKKERLIQVVATHYMGNKKSISLVKVAGEYMVVGVSNDGIQLISKLGSEVTVDKYLEDRYWGGTFEKHLNSYAHDPKVNKAVEFDENQRAAPEAPRLAAGYDGPRDLAAPAPKQTVEPEPAGVPADSLIGDVTDKVELSSVRASIREKLTNLKPLGT